MMFSRVVLCCVFIFFTFAISFFTPIAVSHVYAATTGNLDPTADSASSTMDSANWRNQAATTCSTTTCYTSLNDANNTTYIYASTINNRATFKISTSSIPVGSTVTQIAISFSGADNINGACTSGVDSDSTVQTVRVVDGVATNSGTNITMINGVWATSTQNHTVSFTMNTTTTLEVGVVITGLGVCTSGGALQYLPNFISNLFFSRAGAASVPDTDISKIYAVVTYVTGVTVSGTLYSDEGSTTYTCASGKVVVKVNGSGTASSSCSGTTFSVSGVTINAASDVVTVFVDGNASYLANSITRAVNTSSNISIPLYQNRIIVQHEDSGPITNTNLDQYDNNGDADMLFTVTSGAFTGESSKKIIIPSGETFTPGGAITTPALRVAGTFNQGSNTLTLNSGGTNTTCTGAAGTVVPLCVSGTFNANTGTTSFTGTAATTLAAVTYYNLTINSSGITFTLGGTTTVSNDVTITAGTFAGTSNLTVSGGDISGNGTINFTNGTTTLSGAGNIGGTGTYTFYNLTLSGTSQTTTATSTGGITISNILTISASHTLAAGSKTWTLAGTTGIPLVISGTLTENTSTFTFTGNYVSGNTTVPSDTYYNFTLNNSSETYTGTSPITVSNNFTITAGIFTAPASLTISGSYSNSGTFTAGTGTVTFNATATGKTIAPGSSNFYNVTFNGSGGGWSFSAAVTITSNLTLTAGTLSGTNNITVNGSMTGTGGIVNLTNGTTTLTSESASFGGNTSEWTFTNLQLGDIGLCGTTGEDPTLTTTGSGGIIITGFFTAWGNMIFDPGSQTWTLSGSGTPASICNMNATAGKFVYTGSSATAIATTTYYNLELGTVHTNTTYTLGSITVGNVLSITTSSVGTNIVNGSAAVVTLSGSGSSPLFVIPTSGATFTAASSIFNYTGTATTTITATTYYDLHVKPAANNITHLFPSGTVVVNNNLTVGDGVYTGVKADVATNNTVVSVTGDVEIKTGATYSAAANTLSIGGSYTNNGTFTTNSGTLTLNGTASGKTFSGTMTGSTGKFYNLYISGTGSGAWTASANIEVLNSFNHNSGIFTAPTTLTSSGEFSTASTGFYHNNGTVVLNGAGASNGKKVISDATLYNLTFSGSGDYFSLINDLTVANNFIINTGSSLSGIKNISVGGDVTGDGILNVDGGNVTFTVSSTNAIFGGATDWEFQNLVFGNGSSISTTTATSTGNVYVFGTFTIATSTNFLAGSKVWDVAGFVINGTFTSATSTIAYDSNSSATIASTTYYNLTTGFQPLAGNYSLGGNITVRNDLTLGYGTLSGTSNIIVQGGDVSGGGYLNLTGGTVTLTGNGSFDPGNGAVLNNLTLGDGSTTQVTTSTGTGDISILETLTIATNTTLNGGSRTFILRGTGTPFVKNGTFTAASSTVHYAGVTTPTTITATTTYWNLTAGSSTGNTAYTIPADVTVENILTLTTSTGTNTLNLGNTTTTLSGSATSNGGYPLVIRSNEVLNTGSSTVKFIGDPYVTSGTYWNLELGTDADAVAEAYTLAGDVYVGGVLIVGNNNSTATDTLYASSYTLYLDGINSGSNKPFTVNNFGAFSSDTSTVKYRGNGTVNIAAGSNVTYNNLYILPGGAGGIKHHLGTASGQTITVNGDLYLGKDNSGTIDASQYNPNITLRGNLTIGYCAASCGANSLTYTAGTGTFYFSPATTTTRTWTDNNPTPGAQSLGIVQIANGSSSAVVQFGSNVHADAITIGANHTFNNSSYKLTLAGSGTPFVITGTFTQGTGTVEYIGTASTNIASSTYYNLTVGSSTGSRTYTPAGNFTIQNTLMIATSTGTNAFDATNKTLTMSGISNHIVTNGETLTTTDSTFIYNSGSATTLPEGISYGNLKVQPSSAGITHTLPLGTLVVRNDLTIGNGVTTATVTANTNDTTLDVTGTSTIATNATLYADNTNAFSLGGNFTNNGTFTSNGGEMIFNGASQFVLGSAVTSFATTTLNGITFTASSGNMNITGNFTNNGTFTHNSGTVTFNGTTPQAITGGANLIFNILTITNNSATTTLYTTTTATTLNAVTASSIIAFGGGKTFEIANLNINGQAINTRVKLRSTLDGTQWLIKYTSSSQSVLNTSIKDGGCAVGTGVVNASDVSNENAGGNSGCWNFGATVYAASGTLISHVIDTQITGGVAPNAIMWKGSQPSGTTVKFMVGASSTPSTSTSWTYYGWNNITGCSTNEDDAYNPGAQNTWVEIKAQCHSNMRYLRYKVLLGGDTATSSRVDDVILNYAK